MDNLKINQAASAELHEMLRLRYDPIAVKLIENEADIPENASHPVRDMGKHIAVCQAFALARRNRKVIYTDKNSEWCWCPPIVYGLVDCQPGSPQFELICKYLGFAEIEKAREFFADFPKLPFGKYKGVFISPLDLCPFEPDVVLIYCNNAQLRHMVWAVKNATGSVIKTQVDAIDSCVYSSVVPIKTGEFRVTLPDIGEYERAGADEDEIILSAPGNRMQELLSGLKPFYEYGMGYTQLAKEMTFDFSRPPFYNELFEMWGLEQGADWVR